MNRFNCDSAAADKFVKSWPRVRSPGLPRLEKILDFFLIGIFTELYNHAHLFIFMAIF